MCLSATPGSILHLFDFMMRLSRSATAGAWRHSNLVGMVGNISKHGENSIRYRLRLGFNILEVRYTQWPTFNVSW